MKNQMAIIGAFLALMCGFLLSGVVDLKRFFEFGFLAWMLYLGFGVLTIGVNGAVLFGAGTEEGEDPPRILGCFGVFLGLVFLAGFFLMVMVAGMKVG